MKQLLLALFTLLVTNLYAEWPTMYSGSMPRPILMVHGLNSQMATWGVVSATDIFCQNPKVLQRPPTSSGGYGTGGSIVSHNLSMSCTDVPEFWLNSQKPPSGVNSHEWLTNFFTNSYIKGKMKGRRLEHLISDTDYLEKYRFHKGYVQAYKPYILEKPIYCYNPVATFDRTIAPNSVVGVGIYKIKCDNGYEFEDKKIGFDGVDLVKKWHGKLMYSENFIDVSNGAGFRNGSHPYSVPYNNPSSSARYISNYFGLDTTYYGMKLSDSIEQGINHNGLEFYNATHEYDQSWSSNSKYELFQFADINYSFKNEFGSQEFGQGKMIFNRMSDVLTEYYGEAWKSDANLTLDIVAHSQGGLIIREAIRANRDQSISNPVNHIKSIVTFNTPHLGTAIATDNSGVLGVENTRDIVTRWFEEGAFEPLEIIVKYVLATQIVKVSFKHKKFNLPSITLTSAELAIVNLPQAVISKIPIIGSVQKFWEWSLDNFSADPTEVTWRTKIDPEGLQDLRATLLNMTNEDINLAYPNYSQLNNPLDDIKYQVISSCESPNATVFNTIGNSIISQTIYNVTCANGIYFNYAAGYLEFSSDVEQKWNGHIYEAGSENWLPPTSDISDVNAQSIDRSSFQTVLANFGYPTRPMNGSKIPLTAYYGNVPAQKEYNSLFYNMKESMIKFCNKDVFLQLDADDIAAVSSFLIPGIKSSCTEWAKEIFSTVEPTFLNITDNWIEFSDLVVDVSSQKAQGLFSSNKDPFIAKKLYVPEGSQGVNHMEATDHGVEIIEALLNPPRQFNIVPTIITPLLLN